MVSRARTAPASSLVGTAAKGALLGAIIGLAVSMALGLVVIGTDDIPDIADSGDLPVLYVVAGVIGLGVGAVTGAVGLVLAGLAARGSTGSAPRRRLVGALAAAACAAAVSLVVVSPFVGRLAPVASLVLGGVGGLVAWLALPSRLALETPRAPVASPVAPTGAPFSARRRLAITALVSVAGAFLVTNVAMSLLSLDRDVADVVAFLVLGVSFVALAVVVWLGSAHLVTPAPDDPRPPDQDQARA